MIEPVACGVHAAFAAKVPDSAVVAVLGAGTLGLVTIAALRAYTSPRTIVATARHPHQRSLATELGADLVVAPAEVRRAVRRAAGTRAISRNGESAAGAVDRLTGGADIVIDCVGSSSSLTDALAVTRPGGRIVLVGMPAVIEVELTPLSYTHLTLPTILLV